MIEYPLDESFCFDHYSILAVKLEAAKSKEEKGRAAKMLNFYNNYLRERLGDVKFDAVINSLEYKKLEDCNRDIFKLVDNCYHYDINMRVSAEMSIKRWELKNSIQIKYFGRAASEMKINQIINPD